MREHRKDGAQQAKELEALARMREGDVGGLEVLVRRYQGRAVRAAHLIGGDRFLAQDVIQDAFVHANEQIGCLAEAPPKSSSGQVIVCSLSLNRFFG